MLLKKAPPFFIAFLAVFFSLNHAWADGVTVDDTGAGETVVTMKVELCPDPVDDPTTEAKEGPTKEEVQAFIDERQEQITAIWNACLKKLRLQRGAAAKTIRFVFEYTVLDNCDGPRDPTKKRYKVHAGKPPPNEGKNADSENLWLENTARTTAHELGHGMGLTDEYDHNGGTRENLMGRGSSTKILVYHVMTILFTNQGNPDAAEARRRILVKTLLRMEDQTLARRIAADNGITEDDYNAYKDMFDANATQVQPARPSESGGQ